MKSCVDGHGPVVNLCVWLLIALLLPGGVQAAPRSAENGDGESGTSAVDTELELRWLVTSQMQRLDAQGRVLEEQARLLEEQRQLLTSQQRKLEALEELTGSMQPGDAILATQVGRGDPAIPDPEPIDGSEPAGKEAEVRVAPKTQERPPEIATLADRGGVLTPQGVLVLEPDVEYTSSTVSQFNFDGIEVFEAILIGRIEASDADRDGLTTRVGARFGLTDRTEMTLKVPYLRRRDRVTRRIISQTDQERSDRNLSADGIGDIEIGLHHQFQRTSPRMPYLIGNVVLKTPTGTSPFEVDRDTRGRAEELPTGSGFWSVEPSLTAIFRSDPAVFYGSLGYTWNIRDDVDEDVITGAGPRSIGTVDPGDAIGIGFGMGLSLNETTSFSLGYSHRYVTRTKFELDTFGRTQPLQVGAFQFGLSSRLTNRTAFNVTLSLGVTEDAPDVRLNVRVPLTFRIFD